MKMPYFYLCYTHCYVTRVILQSNCDFISWFMLLFICVFISFVQHFLNGAYILDILLDWWWSGIDSLYPNRGRSNFVISLVNSVPLENKINYLKQGSANLFSEGPDTKYFRLCQPWSFYSTKTAIDRIRKWLSMAMFS